MCTHPARDNIDAALVSGVPYREITLQHAVKKDAISRHKKHVVGALLRACDAQELNVGTGLVEKLRDLEINARRIATEAERNGDLRTALTGIRELSRIVELFAKLKGEIQDATTVNVLVAAPEWAALRSQIMQALLPYPDARFAVAQALEGGRP